MIVYKFDDGNPDGPIYYEDWRMMLDAIKDGLDCLQFVASAGDTYNVTVEAVEMTQEELDALPEY